MATGNYTLPPPPPLEIHDSQAAERWKKFKRAWTSYSLATELNKKSEEVQVATLLTVIGEEAREVFSTFSGWAAEGDDAKITPKEILRDRLVFGIRDNKARERLLREASLTLEKTDEIYHATESMLAQLKIVDDSTVNTIKHEPDPSIKHTKPSSEEKNLRECWNCGRTHELYKREQCPAFGKVCNKCHKRNHFAAKCRSKQTTKTVKSVGDNEEIFQTQVSRVQTTHS